jgi:small subunit ribosomal protein S19e
MVGIYDVDATKLICETAKLLKDKNIEVPHFVPFVKTGVSRQRPPVDEDWWYVRCAAILRTVAIRGPIGTAKLATKYGGKKNRGMKPAHHFKGSGSVIRHALQSLEKAGLLQYKKEGLNKGRIPTTEGKRLLSEAAKLILTENPQKKEQKPVVIEHVEVEENGNE